MTSGPVSRGTLTLFTSPSPHYWTLRIGLSMSFKFKMSTLTILASLKFHHCREGRQGDSKQPRKPTTILLGTEKPKPSPATPADSPKPPAAKREWVEAYCPYCDNNRHFLNGCENFKLLSKEQKGLGLKAKIDAGAVGAVIMPLMS